jgi:hypothetical protein
MPFTRAPDPPRYKHRGWHKGDAEVGEDRQVNPPRRLPRGGEVEFRLSRELLTASLFLMFVEEGFHLFRPLISRHKVAIV